MKIWGNFTIRLLEGILLILGVVYVFIAPFFQIISIFVKPIFLVGLFSFYYANTRKFHWKLFLSLVFVMLGEYFAAKGFIEYYYFVVLFYTGFYFFGVWLLLPVIKNTKVKKTFMDVVMITLGAGGFLFLLFWIYHFTLSPLNQLLVDGLALSSFVIFISCIFYITQFNKQTKNIYIFITGIGYIVLIIGYIIYELVIKLPIILIIVNFAEIMAQFFFIKFIISRRDIIIYGKKDVML